MRIASLTGSWNRLSRTLLLAALAVVPACGPSSSPDTSPFAAACRDAGKLCIVTCNLGCTSQGACTVSDIPENLPLTFQFSQDIDPGSVNPSTFSIRSPTGRSPVGQYVVQGTTVQFVPAARSQGGGTVFGFQPNIAYTIFMPDERSAGETIRAKNGAKLGRGINCTVVTSLGVVDPDGKPPSATLITPADTTKPVPRDSVIAIEFSEVIDTSIFTGNGAGNGIFYAVRLSCEGKRHVLPGDVTFSTILKFGTGDKVGTPVTLVVFQPLNKMPGNSCVEVSVTEQVRDLSAKKAIPVTFTFTTEEGGTTEQEIVETFTNNTKLEPDLSGAIWGGGKLISGKVGGDGKLGEFKASYGKFIGKINQRNVYEWDTTSFDYLLEFTLRGEAYWQKKLGPVKSMKITDGVFEFTNFVLGKDEQIRFVGDKIPRIYVSGKVDIQGIIELPPPGQPGPPLNSLEGRFGAAGRTGGQAGGQGGHHPLFKTGAQTNGFNGTNIKLPPGHPRSSVTNKTGGGGSQSQPIKQPTTSTEFDSLIEWIDPSTPFTSRQTSAGGGGGSFWSPTGFKYGGTAGTTGIAIGSQSYLLDQLKNSKKAFGPDSAPGEPFPIYISDSELDTTYKDKKSQDLFSIGGSGGGGSGADLIFANAITWSQFAAKPAELIWNPGGGGGCGGGAIQFRSGGDFVVGSTGLISCKGGAGYSIGWTYLAGSGYSAGGGGSGGSVLVQTGRIATISGEVNVLGGQGGVAVEKSIFLSTKSVGGNGGAGYIRVESDPKPSFQNFSSFKPASHPENVGKLRPVDYSDVTLAQSKWYPTESLFSPTFQYYEIQAKVDGKDVFFTDNIKDARFRPADESEPVMLLVQSAQIDLNTLEQLAAPTEWYEGSLKQLGSDPQLGNGIRFILLLNKAKATTTQNIEVSSIKIVYIG